MTFFRKYKVWIGYAMAMAALFILVRWLELRLIVFGAAFEMYAGAIAVIFMALGIWLALKVAKPKAKTIIIEKEIVSQRFVRDDAEIQQRNISKRELEVLELMAFGHSNQEIANHLFVSTNTVKTHVSSLFEKLDAKRRIKAVEKAKQLRLIP